VDTVVLPGPSGKVVVLNDSITGGNAATKAAIIASVTGAGGIFYKGLNVATQALKDALEGQILSYDIKFYIQDDNSNYVDMTERSEVNGRNMLRKIGAITHTAERQRGQVQSKISSVVMHNGDGFFDRPMPSSLKATLDTNFDTLSTPVTASFPTSNGGKESVFFRRKAAVRVHYMLTGDYVPNVMTLGVFIIEDFSTDSQSKSATLSFAPLSTPLMEARAELVKRGEFWYRNMPPEFLIRKLLETSYQQSTGGLPTSWDIDPVASYPIPLAGSGGWASSKLSRPPRRYYDFNGNGPYWKEEYYSPRSMCSWTYETGTIDITAGSATISATSSATNQWDKSTADLQNKIQVGDALIISKEYTASDGGSAVGHDGYYTIASISDPIPYGYSPKITLDRIPSGTADETSVKYTIVRIYMGIGPNLYEYNIATDSYRELTTSNTQVGTTNRNHIIRYLWVNTADTAYPIYGLAVSEPVGNTAARYNYRILKFRWNGTTPEVTIPLVGSGIDTGEYIYRESDKRLSNRHYVGEHDGNFDDDHKSTDQTPIVIPFEQNVKDLRKTGVEKTSFLFQDKFGETWSYDGDDNILANPYKGARVNTGHYGAFSTSPITVRHTAGQRGCIQLIPNAFTDGALFMATVSTPAVDTNNDRNTASYWTYTYKVIDLSNGTEYTFTLNPDYIPTATCLDNNGDLILSQFKFGVNDENADVKVSRLENMDVASGSTLTPTVSTLYNQNDDPVQQILLPLEIYHYHDGTNGRLYMSCMFINHIGLSESYQNTRDSWAYRIFMINDSDPLGLTDDGDSPNSSYPGVSTLTYKAGSPNRMQGMCHMNVGTDGTPDHDIFYFESANSRIMAIDHDADTYWDKSPREVSPNTSSLLPYQLVDAVCLPNVKEMYWVEGILPVLNTPEDEQGDFQLCRWSSQYSPIIQLADFSDMSAWEAIDQVAEVANARYGFNPDGSFFFQQKPRHQGSAYTFTNVGKSLIQSIDKKRGQKEVINRSVKIPSIIKRGDIESSFRIGGKSGYGDGGEIHNMDVLQSDDVGKTITLVCDYGGPISIDATDVNLRQSARFKYTIQSNSIETQLSVDYVTSNYYIVTELVGDVKFSSSISVEGDDDGSSITGASNVGIQAKISGDDVKIKTALKYDSNRIVLKRGASTDADLTNTLDTISESLNIGTTLLIGNLTKTAPIHEYVTIIGFGTTDTSNDTIIVSRAVHEGNKPLDHAVDTTVFVVNNVNKIYTNTKISSNIAESFTIGSSVTIDPVWKDRYSTDFYAEPSDRTSDLIDDTRWHPIEGTFVPIGGASGPFATNVSVMLSMPTAADSDDRIKNSSYTFRVGDSIRIVAPGLVIEEDRASPQVAESRGSIAKWGKRESQKRRNKLMDRAQAKWVAMREVLENKDPHYTFTLNTIMAPWISMSDIITVQDQDNLPKSDSFSEKCYITQMTYDPQSRAMMQIVCRSVDAY
jgi:hypothetical protein